MSLSSWFHTRCDGSAIARIHCVLTIILLQVTVAIAQFNLSPNFANSVDRLLVPRPQANAFAIFSKYQPFYGTPKVTAVYNPACFGSPLPLQKICWHDSWLPKDTYGNGVAITPRHLLVTEHGTESANLWHTWILRDGKLVSRKAIAMKMFVAGKDGATSFRVLLLDEDLPKELVCPMVKPGTELPVGTPMVHTNQWNELHVAEIVSAGDYIITRQPADPKRAAYYKPVVGGDSGSPGFLVLGKELVILTWYTTTAGGPNSIFAHDAIIAAMRELDAKHKETRGLMPRYLP